MNLLHISYDLRRRNNQPVTSAVSDIICETEKISNIKIIDLLRVPRFKDEKFEAKNEHHFLLNAFGLPLGLFLMFSS